LGEVLAARAHLEVEFLVGVRVGDAAMSAALAQFGLELDEGQHLVALGVVPLGLAGDDRVSGRVAVRVEVFVALGRLPAGEPLLRDLEASGEGYSVAEVPVTDEPLDEKGTRRSMPVS
jgi:hypothetical protein